MATNLIVTEGYNSHQKKKKINITIYFENITIKLYVVYVLKTCQISYQSDVIYYLIHKLILYIKFWTTKTWNLNIWLMT